MVQGSALGPILFLFYINDSPNIIEIINSILFADFTTILEKHTNKILLKSIMTNVQLLVKKWYTANELSLIELKSHSAVFTIRILKSEDKPIKWLDTFTHIRKKVSKNLF